VDFCNSPSFFHGIAHLFGDIYRSHGANLSKTTVKASPVGQLLRLRP